MIESFDSEIKGGYQEPSIKSENTTRKWILGLTELFEKVNTVRAPKQGGNTVNKVGVIFVMRGLEEHFKKKPLHVKCFY